MTTFAIHRVRVIAALLIAVVTVAVTLAITATQTKRYEGSTVQGTICTHVHQTVAGHKLAKTTICLPDSDILPGGSPRR
jgi:hypothetical protein